MTPALSLLVFAATTLFAGVVLVSVWQEMSSRAEAGNGVDGSAVPLRRLVSPERLLGLRFLSCFIPASALLAFLAANGVNSIILLSTAAIAAGFAGWKAPSVYFNWRIAKRKAAFDAQILGLTMTLANGLRSGMALPQSLEAAVQRMSDPMREEIGTVLREHRLGLELPEALERLSKRMPGEDLKLLVTSVKLTLQTGGSLADVLERMVEMIRSRTEFQEKVKNMTAQGRFEAIAMSLAPLAVYILLRLIDPELMKPLTSTFTGWVAIGFVVVILSVGFFVINKIVTIEV